MSAMNNERNPQVATIYLGSQASGANVVAPGIFFRKRSRIKNVYLVNQAAVSATGNTTDYFTLTLQDNAATPVAYAALTTSGTTLVANTQKAFTLGAGGGSGLNSDQATALETDVPAGTMLNLAIVGTASAQNKVLTNAIALVEYYPL